MQVGTSGSGAQTDSPAANARVLVNVATYNERENIAKLIEEIHLFLSNAHVLVVDDNSPDGTGKVVDELAAADARVHALHRPGKLGLGTAILAGMNYAMQHDYDLMINMDADFSHSPHYLPEILVCMANADVAIGSRYVPGGGCTNWPFTRRMMSRGVNVVVRLLFRMRARDASGGFRCYRVALLRRSLLENFWSRGYSFQQEMLYRCYLAGARIGETPIVFDNRKFGKSKVSLKETTRSISKILYLGVRCLFGMDKAAARRKRRGVTAATPPCRDDAKRAEADSTPVTAWPQRFL
jgi:dolichol-phosphate mannosyltransferase